jgi:hypothetical protein
MMPPMRRALTIRFDQTLPHRALPLSPEKFAEVFGGCIQLGSPCSPAGASCCYGGCQLYKPYPNWPGAYYCDVYGGAGE